MSRCPRLVIGSDGPNMPPPGAIAALALRLAEHARAAGFTVVSLAASRIRSSNSRYLTLRDGRGRLWLVRISNHYKPARTGHLDPHFDLVSKDGVSGHAEACAYLDRMGRGEIAWTAPRRSPKRRGQR
jgi:hypothetical protein